MSTSLAGYVSQELTGHPDRSQMARCLVSFVEERNNLTGSVPLVNLLQIFHTVQAFVLNFDRSREGTCIRDLQFFFSRLAAALRSAASQGITEECADMASNRLRVVGYMDARSHLHPEGQDTQSCHQLSVSDCSYEQWVQTFEPDQSLFGDDLIDVLHHIAGEEVLLDYRVRRLLDIKAGKVPSSYQE